MDTNNDAYKPSENDQNQSETTNGTGQMKLMIRTARVQKYIDVDVDISIKDVSIQFINGAS